MFSETFAKLVFSPIGAFIYWVKKGFRGRFDEEFAKEKGSRNYTMGVLVFFIIAFVVGMLTLKRNS